MSQENVSSINEQQAPISNNQLVEDEKNLENQGPKEYGNIDIRDVDKDYRKLRIYIDGVFDLAHYGHYRLFKQVKDHFPNSILIAGVSSDEETQKLKGQTVLDENERAESVGHCKWVDEVIMPCPWIITQEFMDLHKIDYIAHDGDPYSSSGSADIYAFVKKQGRFIATQRTEGISTTDLINKIIVRYNEFVFRNLQRGVKRHELNLSWTREKRIVMEAQISNNKQRVIDIASKASEKGAELLDNVKEWMNDPNQFVADFLNVFGPTGKITNNVKNKLNKMKDDFVEYAQNTPL